MYKSYDTDDVFNSKQMWDIIFVIWFSIDSMKTELKQTWSSCVYN